MEELKVHIHQVMSWELKITKPLQKQLRKFLVFIAKESLLIAKFKIFSKFHSGDASLRDEPRPSCSSDFDQDALRELVEFNP